MMRPEITGATFVRIPLTHGCILVLTGAEYARAIKRGKTERRREANEQRTRGEGNILEALGEGGD